MIYNSTTWIGILNTDLDLKFESQNAKNWFRQIETLDITKSIQKLEKKYYNGKEATKSGNNAWVSF